MKRRCFMVLSGSLLLAAGAAARSAWPDLHWDELLPPGWKADFGIPPAELARLSDTDPRAIEWFERLRKAWEQAPLNPAVHGRRGRIAGFTLPLERRGDKVTEFLLVPYYGACIHSPPPPANQVIHARSATPLAGIHLMTPVWVYGTLFVQRSSTVWAASGYRMEVDKVTPRPGADRR